MTNVVACVVGAVAGTLLRYATIALWPGPLQLLLSTLLTVGCGFVVLGLLTTHDAPAKFRAFAGGLAGSAASFSVLALLAVSASPLMFVAYVLGAPIAAMVGLTAGVGAGLAIRGRAAPVVG
ncbi:MAG: fluoride exporter [Mycobacterium sp.]|jgi:hypothetical protein|nr:fluoride exporter [Mycobacterium sp.]